LVRRRKKIIGGISGLPITRGGVRLNHLFFLDDSLLFCRMNIDEWNNMQEILEMYEKSFGQKLNREKMSLFFSKNTKVEVWAHIKALAGVNSTQSYEKYLGLLSLIGRSRIRSFKNIEGLIWNRINGWKEKFLTYAGKKCF
jgi:hypothetical protein